MKLSTLKLAGLLGVFFLHGCDPAVTSAPAIATPADIVTPKAAANWEEYHQQSAYWKKADSDALLQELEQKGLEKANLPGKARNAGFDPHQPLEWYTSDEARQQAEAIMSFQTPSGGWSKNTDMIHEPRTAGQAFGTEAGYVPTFDNDATTSQLWFLAYIRHATGDARYDEAFYRGIALLLAAQYPNGGWPQNFPLTGGYHDHITLNDDVLTNNLSLLEPARQGKAPFEFINASVREQLNRSMELALHNVAELQVRDIHGTLTLWGAQHEAKSLQPAAARAYEPASLASAESADLLNFLMTLENPSPAIIKGIHSAAAWLEQTKIEGMRWERGTSVVVADSDAKDMWPRFMEADTGRGLFGDRNKEVYYDLSQVSAERLRGYAWYSTAPATTLKHYRKWAKQFPLSAASSQ
ncbi:pectate lyase [Cellvibrio polysaccharolyticus]|nr:pectate lyase [Cellvibrio polysaccharolyticus]